MSNMNREYRSRERDFEREYDRDQKRYKDERAYSDYYSSAGRTGADARMLSEFRTLCISNINPRASDSSVQEALYQEFKKFGEFNVKVVHTEDRRIAYVNFKYPEDAKDAKYSRGKGLVLFDMPVRVDPVCNKHQRSRSPQAYSRDVYISKSVSPHSRTTERQETTARELSSREREPIQNFENQPRLGEKGQREHKFPYHLHHVQPEDDDKSTRTLFVGNIDHSLTETDLKTVFEKFGVVEDIDIKRPAHGQGNAYAFIKFWNLDMSHRAKVSMSGQYIGNLQCKIGYGKATPSTCLWVGGLGPWVNTQTLESEFDRFGAINRIVWPHGKNHAYVLYDSIDAAQAACQDMRGLALGGPEHRLRIDFADVNHIGCETPPRSQVGDRSDISVPGESCPGNERTNVNDAWSNRGGTGANATSRGEWPEKSDGKRCVDNGRDVDGDKDIANCINQASDRWRQQRNHQENDKTRQLYGQHQAFSPSGDWIQDKAFKDQSPPFKKQRLSSGGDHSSVQRDHDEKTNGNHQGRLQLPGNSVFQIGNVSNVESVSDLAKCLPVVWSGNLVLKNSAFSCCMHLVGGDVRIVDTLMRDPTSTEKPVLKITQRLRLDQPKLDEVSRRMSSCGPNGHSILLAMSGTSSSLDDPNASVQQRPLRNLVSYLKQKDAAGVISLPPNPGRDQEVGVLHAFPPCSFSAEFLKQSAPKLASDPAKEEHLIVLVVRGAV